MKTLAALLVCAVLTGIFFYVRSQEAPAVRTAVVSRRRLEVTLNTNGKVEPLRWRAARAERAGLVTAVPVTRGQAVLAGEPLALLESRDARAELDQAEARIRAARAELETLSGGGRRAEVAALDAELAQAQLNRQQAQRDLEVTQRLEARQAATRQQVLDSQDRVARFDQQIAALTARRAALVNPPDLEAAQARLAEAEAAKRLAQERLALGVVRAPMAGEIYGLPVRPGLYLEPGAEVALIGDLSRLRVLVLVDEPELGRVRAGMPARITWDALPGREWVGNVEKTATQIIPFGTRQVGEIICEVDNRERALLPGANVDVSLFSEVADNALVLPKEAIQRRDGQAGVYLIRAGRLAWQTVRTGVISVTQVEIQEGLREGDRVALPGAVPLTEGLAIRVAP